MGGNPEENNLLRNLRDQSVNETTSQYKHLQKTNPVEFIKLCHKRFCEKKIKAFPYMCEVARVQNILKWRELRADSGKGKYTETCGWSKDGTFKFDYEIPTDLYAFMQNLVYSGFWEEHNRKIWRRFMKRVCDGDDPNRLLVWARSQYGDNQGMVSYGK